MFSAFSRTTVLLGKYCGVFNVQDRDRIMSELPQDLPEIVTLEQMGDVVTRWFTNRHMQLDAIQKVPAGDTLQAFDESTGEIINFEGEQRTAFLLGVQVAQSIFREPPFSVVTGSDEPTT